MIPGACVRSSTGRIVCWVGLGFHISPLLQGCAVLNLLDAIGYEHVKSSGLTGDVPQDNLTVGPECFFDFLQLKLPSELLADFHGHCSCGQLQPWNRNCFQWGYSALPIMREQ